MHNLTEAVAAIKSAGTANVRIVPMHNESILGGLHSIEIKQADTWSVVIQGITRSVAEGIVSQALNRTICG